MAPAKIQLKGQFVITRDRSRPLSLQIVAQLQEAIETGRLVRGTRLPSTRSLARTLSVSRNTVLTAYEELVSRGLLRSRRGAGMYVLVPVGLSGFNLKAIMREAQYPSRTIALRDQDGNPLCIWKARKAAVREEIASAERAAKAIQGKLDRLDEAFLFERSIDIETYDRHAEKLREELTLVRIDRHSGQLDELDVEGILAFAERVLPRAADLWVQASLEQRQRFQQLFFLRESRSTETALLEPP